MPPAVTAPLREDALPRPADVLPQGATVGRYVVVDVAGKGTGGTVYAAYDGHLGRKVALKLVHRHRSADPHDTGRWSVVVREARALARLDHPNVVTVHDVGDDGERAYIAMEFVDGVDLSGWLSGARELAWRRRLEPFLAAGVGLAAAHRQAIVHGDFKPANILRGTDGRVRVTDFGVALFDDGVSDTDPSSEAAPGNSTRTHTGELWGTPLYMAPELFDGDRPTPASDVYSFCACAFEALFGRPPAEGETLDALHDAKLGAPEVPPDVRVPRRVRDVVLSGLAVEPRARPKLPLLLTRLRRAARPRARRGLDNDWVALLAITPETFAGRVEGLRVAGVA